MNMFANKFANMFTRAAARCRAVDLVSSVGARLMCCGRSLERRGLGACGGSHQHLSSGIGSGDVQAGSMRVSEGSECEFRVSVQDRDCVCVLLLLLNCIGAQW